MACPCVIQRQIGHLITLNYLEIKDVLDYKIMAAIQIVFYGACCFQLGIGNGKNVTSLCHGLLLCHAENNRNHMITLNIHLVRILDW